MSIERISGRTVVASISGGKDSAAMSLHLMDLGIEHRRVFMDTGWEHERTYEYLRGELTRVIGPIEEIRGPLLMDDLIRSKGMFPSRQRRFCTQELKVKPMIAYLKAMEAEPVNTVGIRAGESQARSKMTEWEWQDGFDCEVWRPLINWSLDDVIAIHKRHGLRPNPLYLDGASRVGCWPCIFARKGEIRMIADMDPARIDRLRVLEDEITTAMRARYEARGETFDVRPSWFQASDGRVGSMPIDEAVRWSRTAFGGRQYELFAPTPGDEGCMRWGLCGAEGEP